MTEIHSSSSSPECSSNNSSNTSISMSVSPLEGNGLLVLSPPRVRERGKQTLHMLYEACRKTDKLWQKVQRKGWLQINKSQCREFLQLNSLTAALYHFVEELRNETPEVQANCWAATREMYKLICVTEDFVQDCGGPVVPIRALTKIGNGADFCLMRFQLIWGLRVLKLVLSQVKGESHPVLNNMVVQSFSEENNIELEGYVHKDREALLKKLRENAGSSSLKRCGCYLKEPERRILQFLCREYNTEENSARLGISRGSPEAGTGDFLEQVVSTKCVFVNMTDIKWDQKPFIGRGNFGVVASATWLGERFAVKNVHADFEVFMQEVNHQAGLRHPHILPIYGYSFDQEKRDCYMVMELARENLRSYIRRQKDNLTLEFKVDIMLQIAEGMKHLHSKDLIHRDLKAENVLVQWKEIAGLPAVPAVHYVQAKLGDFGLARTKFDDSNSIGKTPNVGSWIAPEVFKEIRSVDDLTVRANYSVEADVYSFAMTFYEVLTGGIPFEDGAINWKTFRDGILNGKRPELPGECPKYLTCYIKRCWDGIPRRRPSFADICKMLRHFKVLLLRVGEGPPTDLNIFSVFTAADLEASRYHLGIEWCINSINEGMIFKEVFLSWIMVEEYRLNAKAEEKYNEVLLMAAERFANFTGLEHDFSRAFSFIQEAAERGYAEAQWKAGLFLELGLGVKKNEREAVRRYEDAKNQNYLCALVELGRCYEHGKGVEKSHNKASELCKQAYRDCEGNTIQCINELFTMLNQAVDHQYSELAAERLFQLTFEDGRALVAGSNAQNIELLVNALDSDLMSDVGRNRVVLILKNIAENTEIKEEIIYSGGIAALTNHLKLVRANDRWCRDAVETLGLLFDGTGTEAVYFSVQNDIIAVLDECLRYNAPCFVDVLIRCLQGNVSKLWLRRNIQVVSSLRNIRSRAPGVSNDKSMQIMQRLEDFGFKE